MSLQRKKRAMTIQLMCFMLILTGGLLVFGAPQNEIPKTKYGPDDTKPSESNEAFLGLGVTSIPAGLAAQLPDVIKSDRGVMVAEVVAGSPASKAGLKQFDLIVMYNDQEVFSPEHSWSSWFARTNRAARSC